MWENIIKRNPEKEEAQRHPRGWKKDPYEELNEDERRMVDELTKEIETALSEVVFYSNHIVGMHRPNAKEAVSEAEAKIKMLQQKITAITREAKLRGF